MANEHQFDAAERETAGRRKREFAATFDQLISSNMALSESVGRLTDSAGRLVKLSWAIVALNCILITTVVAILVWVATRGPR